MNTFIATLYILGVKYTRKYASKLFNKQSNKYIILMILLSGCASEKSINELPNPVLENGVSQIYGHINNCNEPITLSFEVQLFGNILENRHMYKIEVDKDGKFHFTIPLYVDFTLAIFYCVELNQSFLTIISTHYENK